MKNTLIITLAMLFLGVSAFAQTILPNTTLSAAVTSSGKQVIVASATGLTANVSKIYVDRELMDVQVISGTNLTVGRGMGGTKAAAHASAALVFVGQPQWFTVTNPMGSCTRTNELALPKINVIEGIISDCLGGQWVNGDARQTQRYLGSINEPPTAGTAYTAIETSGTAAGAATETYCTQLNLPYSKLITGLGLLNGTTATTDNHTVQLYDSSGYLLANSAAAGVLAATASVYQQYAFTTPFYAVGPAVYYGCFQANGTTATVRHVITGVNDNRYAFKLTGQTFGTFPAKITNPGTFTTALGAYFQIY
jgi:hypothetical protein